MDAPSTASARISTLRPKYIEIMNRLLCGQSSKTIAEEMKISPNRLSIIINSPLFKMEMRRRLMRRELMMLEMEEEMIAAAKLGIQVHKNILDSKNGTYPMEIKLKAATTMATLGARLLTPKFGKGGFEESEEKAGGYEERLKEVVIREKVKTTTPPKPSNPQPLDEIQETLQQNYPDDEDLSSSLLTPEEEELESYKNAITNGQLEESLFTPTKKIPDILEGLAEKEKR